MALILAVNPGATQSATLSRLARELHDCELIGADSYAIAIKAIDQRAPDLVLLPGTDALAEAELVRRLKAVPRRVATLKLPPPGGGVDIKGLAAQVREILEPGSAQVPAGTSPHLLAAAAAAVKWIQVRRAAWPEPYIEEDVPAEPEAPMVEPAQANAPDDADLVARLREAALDVERERERQRLFEEDQPSALEKAVEAAEGIRASLTGVLPRLAAGAVVLVAASALVIYWPVIRDTVTGTFSSVASSRVVEPEDPAPAPTSPGQTSAAPPAAAAPAAADPENRVPGWVAVFAPFEVSISEGNKPVLLDDGGRAMLPPGAHRLRFRNPELGYDEVRTVQIRPTETTTLNLVPKTLLGVTSSQPADVLVDGTRIGQTPVAKYRLDLGMHTITVRASDGERQFTVDATMKPIQLDVDFSKP
jgi:hypothetical protein